MTRALCGIPSYPRHVTSACNVAAYLESDSFGCALRSPFSEISHAAIPPSAALCSEREVTYLLSLNGFIFIFTCLISYFGIKVNLFTIFRIFQVTIRVIVHGLCVRELKQFARSETDASACLITATLSFGLPLLPSKADSAAYSSAPLSSPASWVSG